MSGISAQSQDHGKILNVDDYNRWSRINSVSLSDDGNWMSYGYRLGKKVILLSYPDENHHLANENNQIDFQRRMKQFFDHHLKGADAPEWMNEGIPYKYKKYNKAR